MRSLVASLGTWAPAAHHIARASLRAPPVTARPGAIRRILTGVHDGPASEGAGGNELETMRSLVRSLVNEKVAAAAAEPELHFAAAESKLYNDITVLLPPIDDQQPDKYRQKRMGKASRAFIRRLLDIHDCVLVVDPDSGELVPLEALQLQDGMTITAELPDVRGTRRQKDYGPAAADDYKLYNDVTLLLPPNDDQQRDTYCSYKQKRMGKASRASIRSVLNKHDCVFVVDPDSGELVPLEALQLQDGMTITAELPDDVHGGADKQVGELLNWQRTMSKAREEEAVMAMLNEVAEEHSGEATRRVFVSKVLSKNGQMREIDGMAVTAGGHVVAILKAKTKVDIDKDIEQLQSAIEFLREQPLVDPLVQTIMKAAKVVYGYLSYKVLPDSEAEVAELLDKCKKLNIRVLHTSGARPWRRPRPAAEAGRSARPGSVDHVL